MDDFFFFFWFFMVFVKILLTSSSWLLSLSKRMCSTNSMCFSVQPLWNIWKMFTECLYQLFVSVNKNMFQANEKNARTISILVVLLVVTCSSVIFSDLEQVSAHTVCGHFRDNYTCPNFILIYKNAMSC